MKAIFNKAPYCFVVIFCITLFSCYSPNEQIITINGKTMGTSYTVKFVNTSEAKAADSQVLANKLDQRLIEINQLMSTYISNSELSMLNNAPANQAFPISNETAQVIRKAMEINKLSDGKLDITVGPLVNLWGFGPKQRPEVIPSMEQIEEVRPYVGSESFELRDNRVVKRYDQVYIDLSTIAKGYAVDELANILEAYAITNYLVEIGGEMRLSGSKPGQQDWVVAIEKPITYERAIQRTIIIGDNAIASSGDYRNYYEEDGLRFSHLIDPSTAQPIQHNLVSVSVVASTSIEADGLATALIVMGAEKGRALAERENIAALFITKEENEFVEYRSTAFERQVKIIQ
jgi:thiamine biosynthesis lipoprotein